MVMPIHLSSLCNEVMAMESLGSVCVRLCKSDRSKYEWISTPRRLLNSAQSNVQGPILRNAVVHSSVTTRLFYSSQK